MNITIRLDRLNFFVLIPAGKIRIFVISLNYKSISMNHPDYKKELFPAWLELPVRFRDLDPLNHVNNALFSTFYEEARIDFISRVPSFAGQLNNGYSFVLANIEIDFVRPVEYPAKILVGTGIRRVGNTSITSFQAIFTKEGKKLASVAEASGVWFDIKRKKPARLPEIKDDKLMLNDRFFDE